MNRLEIDVVTGKQTSINLSAEEQTAALAKSVVEAGKRQQIDIKNQLSALDFRRIRPLAEGDSTFLAQLNDQIKALRAQLK